ncbi:MAG: zinc-binding dehydrogenase [Calditrichaceae bacterium]
MSDLDVLKIDNIDKPVMQPDEILIEMKAVALNHLDLWVRKGLPGVPLPLIMGSEGAGIIKEIGKNAPDKAGFKPGDEVVVIPIRSCGKCAMCRNNQENLCEEFAIPGEHVNGLLSGLVSVPARYVFKKPALLNLNEAASYPLTAITAYHMLMRKTSVKKDDWILIWGASSGVGSMAIQIAKAFGAQVITTAGSEEKVRMAEQLGADFVINYHRESVGRKVREITQGGGVDIVFEHTGAKTWPDSLKSLKRGGKLVTCGATTGPVVRIDLRVLFIKQQQIIGSTMGTFQDFEDINRLIEKGKLKPLVDKVFKLEDIRAAHKHLENGEQFGKVVIELND